MAFHSRSVQHRDGDLHGRLSGHRGRTPDLKMVPEAVLYAMLIAHWNANRKTSVVGAVPTEIQFGVEAILNQFRVGRIA